MISFNKRHYNLDYISRKSKLFSSLFKYGYRIYGLKQESSDYVISIYLQSHDYYKREWSDLREWSSLNNIPIHIGYKTYTTKYNHTVYIGLRRDLREHKDFCVALLKTIIYYIEGKTKIENFKVPNVPKFEQSTVNITVNNGQFTQNDEVPF